MMLIAFIILGTVFGSTVFLGVGFGFALVWFVCFAVTALNDTRDTLLSIDEFYHSSRFLPPTFHPHPSIRFEIQPQRNQGNFNP